MFEQAAFQLSSIPKSFNIERGVIGVMGIPDGTELRLDISERRSI